MAQCEVTLYLTGNVNRTFRIPSTDYFRLSQQLRESTAKTAGTLQYNDPDQHGVTYTIPLRHIIMMTMRQLPENPPRT